MRIGVNCFCDKEIISIIESLDCIGECDITGDVDVYVYDTNGTASTDIPSVLSGILDVYSVESDLPSGFPDSELKEIDEVFEKDWHIFSIARRYIKTIIQEICKDYYPLDSPIYREKVGIMNLCDSAFMKRECLMGESTWEKFVISIKQINRFHSNHLNLDLFKEVCDSLSLKIDKGNNSFYRGRISDEVGFPKEMMGAPRPEYASSGRANSQGISCLYMAGDEITTLHELRARDLDYITIGKFCAKQDLQIVDLSSLDTLSPFTGVFEYDWFAINLPILKKISSEIAKPLRRQDSEIDYLPTQYIADFVKSNGYAGICYASTLNTVGINYAIFEPKKFECIDVKLIQVTSLDYNIRDC